MLIENAPIKKRVEVTLLGPNVDAYKASAGSDIHKDGVLGNEGAVVPNLAPDADDHRMSREDAPGPDVPEGFRD